MKRRNYSISESVAELLDDAAMSNKLSKGEALRQAISIFDYLTHEIREKGAKIYIEENGESKELVFSGIIKQ